MELIVLALCWLAGITAVAAWDAPAWMAPAWLITVAPMVYYLRGRRLTQWLLVGAAVALAGGCWFARWEDRPEPSLAAYLDQEVVIEGRVASESDPGITTVRYRLDVKRVEIDGVAHDVSGDALVTVSQFTEWRRGDFVRLSETLETPPDLDLGYREYLLRQGVVGTMLYPKVLAFETGGRGFRRSLEAIRLRSDQAMARSIPEPEASLGSGIVLGRDGTLPEDVVDDFRATGLAHLTAVSGGNVILVAALVFLGVGPLFNRRTGLAVAFLAVGGYVLLAGASPSVLRAGVMAATLLIGCALGRPQSGLPALGVAIFGMTIVRPGLAMDVGFQLSVAATASLIVFGPWATFAGRWLLRTTHADVVVPGIVTDLFALTLVATLGTTPISAHVFERVSLIGPLANVLVQPIFVIAFALSGVTALTSMAWTQGGWLAGLAAYYPLSTMTYVARTLASWPLASVPVPSGSATWVVAAYVALAVIGWPAYRYVPPEIRRVRPWRHTRTVRLMLASAGAGGLLAAIIRVSILPIGGPDEFELRVLDVGQGDAILLTTPHGKQVLVDGGPAESSLADELGRVLPHWERTIDVVILTHGDEDHAAALARQDRRYLVGQARDNGQEKSTTAYHSFTTRLVPDAPLLAGDVFTVDGVTFTVLWPPAGFVTQNANEASIVMRVDFGETSFLLTGDVEGEAQELLARAPDAQVDVLKVPHHGSKTSDAAFLQGTGATVAVISVGESNRYGHPA
ncbi:hypothetical protein AYO38_11410, partial [bacterium SCGC AG-212-C10]